MIRHTLVLVFAIVLGGAAQEVAGGGFVLDGGDLEAAPAAEGACPVPRLTESAAAVDPSPLVSSIRAAAALATAAQATTPSTRPAAFEYSDGYYKRLKVHKIASLATLPLFVTQVALGQKLYEGNDSEGTRDAHKAVAFGTAALFGVNTVTGVMNLYEGRKDPARSTKTKVHGILMLAADAGFVATGFLAPGEDGGGNRSAHRAVALTSVGVATAAYLIMLLGN